MFNRPSTIENRSLAQFSFFKALCCNGNHFLCDFSNEVTSNDKKKYLVDIEIPGHEPLHVEMEQDENNRWHADGPLGYNGLEEVLDDAIYSYTILN
ncbi:MAG: hypothetical protein JSS82_15340 [Bacteroidetes bacterium]|nr:hypothetical protein [Bacteroidota bacterium]